MSVFVPTVPVDPAGIHAAADQLHRGGAALAEQADVLVQTWTGLGSYYHAPETPALTAALDPVLREARLHQTRLATVRAALNAFATEAQLIIRRLDALRAAAVGASPAAAAAIELQVTLLLAQLRQAELRCAIEIRSAVAEVDHVAGSLSSTVSWLALLAGDRTIGSGYLDTDLEYAALTHFTNGTGREYVLSAADLEALRGDPAVRRSGEAIRAGVPGVATPVTLEGGRPGFRVDIDFKQPDPGRAANPFDGSVGRGRVFFDAFGNPVGISDAYDFTNPGNAADLVNLDGGLLGSESFHLRGGVIEAQPLDRQIPVQPDAGTAFDRLFRRNVLGQDPGPYTGPR